MNDPLTTGQAVAFVFGVGIVLGGLVGYAIASFRYEGFYGRGYRQAVYDKEILGAFDMRAIRDERKP